MNFLSKGSGQILELATVIAIVYFLFKTIDAFTQKSKDKILAIQSDTTILGFFPLLDKILKIIILFIAIATLLQSHGYSITSLITGFGITGLAVGLGAQITIANFFGSFALLADKAFKIGDYIIVNQTIHDKAVEGFVEEINLRSTKIRTEDGGLVIIPNNIVANGVVKNISQKVVEKR